MTVREVCIAITEIDLLSYADGLLENDPDRKRAVEIFLSSHPADAARVEDIAAQNRAIRQLYGPIADEPLPERLLELLYGTQRRARSGWRRVAASIAVLLATAAGGWFLGLEYTRTPTQAQIFVDEAMTLHRQMPKGERTASPLASSEPSPLRPETDTPTFDPPDLSALGYGFQGTRIVEKNRHRLLQLTYLSPNGGRLSLFLRNRWPREEDRIALSRQGDLSMAYWLDGPLLYGAVGNDGETDVSAIAEAVRAETGKVKRGAPKTFAEHAPVINPQVDTAPPMERQPSGLRIAPEAAVAAPRDVIVSGGLGTGKGRTIPEQGATVSEGRRMGEIPLTFP